MTKIYETLTSLNNFTNTLFGVKQKGGELTDAGKARLAAIQRDKEADQVSEEGTGAVTGPNSTGAELLDTISGVAKTVIGELDKIIPESEYADKEWSEVAPNIIHNIEGPALMTKEALEDPAVRAALKNALESYSQALGEAMEIAEPELNDITEKLMEVLDHAGEKGARGVATAIIDTGLAMIEAVPGGQIVGLLAAMGYWFNAVVVTTAIPAIKTNAIFLSDGIKMAQNTKEKVIDKYGPRLQEAQSQLTTAIQNVHSNAAEARAHVEGAKKVAKLAQNPTSVSAAASVLGDSKARKIAYKASTAAAKSQSSDNPFKNMEYSSQTRGGGYSAYGGSKKKRKDAARTMRRLKRTLNRFQRPKNSGTRKARRHRLTRKK